jgi:phosphoacetylglucosamine mutase
MPTIVYSPTPPNLNEVLKLLKQYPIPSDRNGTKIRFEYGTAGFRCHHELLAPVMIRMGIFACLRSAAVHGDSVGIMITASHNPVHDNGIKLADSNGGMLPLQWEEMATDLANTEDWNVVDIVHSKMVVHIGYDTRPHSLPFSKLVIATAKAMGAMVVNHGCITTPMLHYHVLRSNPHNTPNVMLCGSKATNFEMEYIQSIIGSYVMLLSTKGAADTECPSNTPRPRRDLVVDCACGVGGLMIPRLNKILERYYVEGGILFNESLVQLIPINLPGDGPLNDKCGAEYVQKQQKLPKIYSRIDFNVPSHYVASLDGDADRIVFHYKDRQGRFSLLDGDKIAVLISSFLQEEINALADVVPEAKEIRCGIVQTAYANGASTHYLKNVVRTKVIIAKTGVKHVHSAAHDNFDVGTYFEANGHGTVLFGSKFYDLLAKAEQKLMFASRSMRSNIAWQRLRVLPSLINQAVGDALSDLFIVDAILYLKDLTCHDWNQIYRDLPSRQCKVKVVDRSVIHTNENETKATQPTNLQPAIDAAMRAVATKNSVNATPRAFVRPSGTENVVRIYAEAASQKEADALATESAAIIYKLCNGVGDLPNFTLSKI